MTMHVCALPRLAIVDQRWACPDCCSEFVYRAVASRELRRIVHLWVRSYEPPNHIHVPTERRSHTRRWRVGPTNREATS